jgi:hypothetical protein
MAMPEADLNRRITRVQEELRLQRKRSYLTAIEQGEQPTINPFEFDEPTAITDSDLETPQHQYCIDSSARIQLALLKYSRGSYTDLQNFLFELENRFARYSNDFSTENDKVAYAISSLTGSQQTCWHNYISIHHPGNMARVTWDEMSQWLTNGLTDNAT